jgi:hypothetical protein
MQDGQTTAAFASIASMHVWAFSFIRMSFKFQSRLIQAHPVASSNERGAHGPAHQTQWLPSHASTRASQASAGRCSQIDRASQVAALAAASLFFLFFLYLFLPNK